MDHDRFTNLLADQRAGFSSLVLLMMLVVAAAVGGIAWNVYSGHSSNNEDQDLVLHRVEKAHFVYDIIERGAVESAGNIEVRCEVEAQGSAGTRIIEIVPEGAYVKEGEVICRLDSSTLENDRLEQQGVVESANAVRIQAENDHKTAKIALVEYENGKFEIEKALIEADLKVALETARRARDNVLYSTQLLEKGYITKLQLEADRFAAQKADTDKRAADLKRKVLREYTFKKMMGQLNSSIKTTKARLEAQSNMYRLEKRKLELIEKQIANCTIKAPSPGQAVYANVTDHHGAQEIIIEEGTLVRQRQVIIRLPDPKRMQVRAKINEARISLLREGQTAGIRMDARPDTEMAGVVRKISEYPAPSGRMAANVKEYETVVEILGSPAGVRAGLNAEVKIRVAQFPDVVQVPVKAVLEHGGKHYSMVRTKDNWAAQSIEIGATNDKVVIVKRGLEAGEIVALGAASLREKVQLSAGTQ